MIHVAFTTYVVKERVRKLCIVLKNSSNRKEPIPNLALKFLSPRIWARGYSNRERFACHSFLRWRRGGWSPSSLILPGFATVIRSPESRHSGAWGWCTQQGPGWSSYGAECSKVFGCQESCTIDGFSLLITETCNRWLPSVVFSSQRRD